LARKKKKIMMKIHVEGNGVFGPFLRELLYPLFDFDETANSVILAVPSNAYTDVAIKT